MRTSSFPPRIGENSRNSSDASEKEGLAQATIYPGEHFVARRFKWEKNNVHGY